MRNVVSVTQGWGTEVHPFILQSTPLIQPSCRLRVHGKGGPCHPFRLFLAEPCGWVFGYQGLSLRLGHHSGNPCPCEGHCVPVFTSYKSEDHFASGDPTRGVAPDNMAPGIIQASIIRWKKESIWNVFYVGWMDSDPHWKEPVEVFGNASYPPEELDEVRTSTCNDPNSIKGS